MSERIVIIGGGFAGLSTAVNLSRHIKSSDDIDILLVDMQPEHVYLPLIYEVASGGLMEPGKAKVLKRGVSIPFGLDGTLTGHENIRFRQGEVVDINTAKSKITLSSGAIIGYDYLVMAMGATNGTFGINGIKKNAMPLLTLDDALKIRERSSELLHECEKKLRSSVNMVVVGGGPKGVEISAEIATSLEDVKRKRGVVCDWNIIIVDAGAGVLSSLSKTASLIATRRLRRIGVKIAAGTFVMSVKSSSVTVEPNKKIKNVSPYTKEKTLKSDLTIWAAGISARPQWKKWGLPVDERGYIKTLPTLQMFGANNVFIAGDSASIIGRRMKQRAPEAVDQGKVVAENLIRIVRGKAILRDHPEKNWPFSIPLGGRNAVSIFGPVPIIGLPGYIFRKAVDLRYFLSIMSIRRAFGVWWHGGKTYLANDKT